LSHVPEDATRFSPASFFAAASARLHAIPPEAAAEGGGDHVLNPDFLTAATDYRDAAVLIPVIAHPEGVSVLLTERTAHLSAHPGQIAFPGGKIDAGDAGPAAAAIREAGEEVGLDPAAIAIIGYLDPYLSRTGYRILPVLGRLEPGYTLTLNRHEVTEAFEVPLAFLMDTDNHRRGTRAFMGKERYFYEMPFEERYIWGVTAGIIRALYEQVFA
jgi:8-oxo-dGTP pyrophosphatase MutT (NUDIX family)